MRKQLYVTDLFLDENLGIPWGDCTLVFNQISLTFMHSKQNPKSKPKISHFSLLSLFINPLLKIKEEEDQFPNFFHSNFVDLFLISYGFFTLGIPIPKGSFQIWFPIIQFLGFLLYKWFFFQTWDLWLTMKNYDLLWLTKYVFVGFSCEACSFSKLLIH